VDDRLLGAIHDEAHLARLRQLTGRSDWLDPDTRTSPGSTRAAWLAAGAAVEAVRAVVRGEATSAFALVRPPGHHARRESAMGFCLLNNVAVAAEWALREGGCRRVLIVDWDVHHGNGTQESFWSRDDVLYVSTHRYPFYPGTGAAHERGAAAGEGRSVNVPLPAGMGDADYGAIFAELLEPIAEQYAPDFVLISAGYDAHLEDPLGGMALSEEGFAALSGCVRRIADRHCGRRIALVLEGGYDLQGLAHGVRATLEVLAGAEAPPVAGAASRASAAGERALRAAQAAQRPYWKMA
jgi:acetoin utilization deacetylase AcuC-like enzyme